MAKVSRSTTRNSAAPSAADKIARLIARQQSLDAQIKRIKAAESKRRHAAEKARRVSIIDALEKAGAFDLPIEILLGAVNAAKAMPQV